MKKKVIAGIGAMTLILSLGISQSLMAADTSFASSTPPSISGTRSFEGMGDPHGERPDGEKTVGKRPEMGAERRELADEEKAEMEAMRAEREAQLTAFLETLTDEQLALHEAVTPARTAPTEGEAPTERQPPAVGEKPERPDETAMAEMKAKQEAFLASLTEEQKSAYDKLFENMAGMGRRGGPVGGSMEKPADQ